MGQVTKWQMTPEQLAEYLEKYPIRKQPEQIKDFDSKVDYRWPATKKVKAAR